MLYAAYRGSANGLVYSWDLRSRIDIPLAVYDARGAGGENGWRSMARNQKVRFDVDVGGRYIATGNSVCLFCYLRDRGADGRLTVQDGEVVLFDVEKTEAELEAKVAMEDERMEDGGFPVEEHVQPALRFKAHNGIPNSFLPTPAGPYI